MNTNNLVELLSGAVDNAEVVEEVPVEKLDYDYVGSCADAKELRNILAVLKSGKEGRYPHLEQRVEERIVELLPPDARAKVLSAQKGPTREEKQEADSDLRNWLAEMDKTKGTSKMDRHDTVTLPPARNGHSMSSQPTKLNGASAATAEPKRDSKAEAFQSYYKRWDEFDVDAALAEMSDDKSSTVVEKQSTAAKPSTAAPAVIPATSPAPAPTPAPAPVPAPAPAPVSAAGDTAAMLAAREKAKGNEAIKSKEYETALKHYTASLGHDSTSKDAAIVYANRAQAHLCLNNFQRAEEDATHALTLDSSYTKAWMRRGNARMKRGKYLDAADDFDHAVRVDPASSLRSECETLAKEARRRAAAAGERRPEATPASSAPSATPTPTTNSSGPKGGRKLVIEEVSDDDEDEKAAAPAPAAHAQQPAAAGKKVVIQEDSDEDDVDTSNAHKVVASKEKSNADTTIHSKTMPPSEPTKSSPPPPTTTPAPQSNTTTTIDAKQAGNEAFSAGNYIEAARLFGIAADAYLSHNSNSNNSNNNGSSNSNDATTATAPTAAAAAAAVVLANRALAHIKAASQKNEASSTTATTTTTTTIAASSSSTFLERAVDDAACALTLLGVRCPGEMSVLAFAGGAQLSVPELIGSVMTPSRNVSSLQTLEPTLGEGKEAHIPALTRVLASAGVFDMAVQIQDKLTGLQLQTAVGDPKAPVTTGISVAVKALHRRGTAFELLGDYKGAVFALAAAVALEPANEKVKEDLRRVRSLYKSTAVSVSEGAKKVETSSTSSAIEEVSQPIDARKTTNINKTVEPPQLPAASTTATTTSSTATPPSSSKPAVSAASATAKRVAMSPPTVRLPSAITAATATATPPKTAFDFEAQINKRKSDPAAIAAYLTAGFSLPAATPADSIPADVTPPISTLYRRAIEPDVVGLITSAISTHVDVSVREKALWVLAFFSGLSKTPSFAATFRMFTTAERDICAKVVAAASKTVGDSVSNESIAKVKAAFA